MWAEILNRFCEIAITAIKAESPQVGIFLALNFLPWEFLLIKKLEIEKTNTTYSTTFKTDMIKVVLFCLIANFFTKIHSL